MSEEKTKAKKKHISKVVNRSGKSIVKKALVVKTKKQSEVNTNPKGQEAIRKLNEEVKNKKERAIQQKSEVVSVTRSQAETEKKKEKPDKKYNLTVDVRDMLAAGCHLGHKKSKTHPKAKKFVYTTKDGIEIFDLTKSFEQLEKACNTIYNSRRNGKQILLVGTKRQAKEAIKRVAQDAGVSYVTDRWLGGTVSNWDQIKKNIKKLNSLKDGIEKGEFAQMTKREQSLIKKEITRLERIVGGLTNMNTLFDVMFVVDSGFEKTAIKEARAKGILTIAMVDSESNPDKVDLAIPVNDDSVKSIGLIIEEIGKAIKAA